MQRLGMVLSRGLRPDGVSVPAVLLVIVATSTLAHAQVSRDEVEAAFAKSIEASHACGGRYRTVYDWKSYDALDWRHHDRSKDEQLGYELSNVEVIGSGLDDACADRDCKAVLGKVDTIVYRATADETAYSLDAKISGHTVTFVNHVFGSTHDGTDYYQALKRGCATATLPDDPDDKPRTSKPKRLGKPSAKWDATYPVDSVLGSAGNDLCLPTSARPLKVSHGKFSVPWYAQDWTREDADDAKPVKVGHLDGVVHADGTASVAMVWDGRPLAARDVRTVRIKRALAAIQTASLTFKVADKDREVQLALDVEGLHCELGWAIRAPRKRDPRNEHPYWGRHQSEHAYETIPEWKEDVTYGRGTRVKHSYSVNPDALFYECIQDTCSSDVTDRTAWRVYGWY